MWQHFDNHVFVSESNGQCAVFDPKLRFTYLSQRFLIFWLKTPSTTVFAGWPRYEERASGHVGIFLNCVCSMCCSLILMTGYPLYLWIYFLDTLLENR